MDLKTYEPGQRNWVDIINNNFKSLNVQPKSYHEKDIALLNGWETHSSGNLALWLATYPMLNGYTLKYLSFDLNGHASPGRYDSILKLPQELATDHGNVVESNITVNTDDKTGTGFELVIDASFMDATTLAFRMKPPYGAPAHDIMTAHVYGAVMYI